MVALEPGLVILVRFPFSDLSSSKLRPAVVLAHSGGEDWVLCQVTSNPYGDRRAVSLTDESFASGGLQRASFARPGKLFTASASIVVRKAAVLVPAKHWQIIESVIDVLRLGKDT